MSNAGSISIELRLDRSRFDSELQKLSRLDVGDCALRAKLDTAYLNRQIKELRELPPILIGVGIDATAFNQQIKKLSTSIDPIKVDLAPNVKDFQEKLRRVGKISPINVEINVDEGKVKQQFETIGKYAAAGFTQGFSGTEDAGKSAIDSMVRSVNKQLGIQSPSKVFKDIGKYAIAGLMQGLDSVDESKLKGVVNKVEGYFKAFKIKINVDVDASGVKGIVKVQAPAENKQQSTADFAENISKSIEEGFQKAKPKTNFLGSIFGGLGSLITIPLAGVLRGAFEGIGTPLGLQLGTGVSKAIQSTLGQNIGSLELISQRAVEKSLQAIPAAQSAIVEVIKNNPIGGAVVEQLELLQRTLELYSINLSPKKAVESLTTEQERTVVSSSATFESQQSQFKSRSKAKASASNEFVTLVDQKGEVDKISGLIKQKEQDLTAKLKKLSSAQNAIASLQTKQERLSQLPSPDSEAEGKRISAQISEFSQALAGGSLGIEQDTKDIQSLKEAKNAYLEKLNKQIKILAELGIEKDLSSQSAEILKGIDVFEQMISAQKAVQEARKNVKSNANTVLSIRGKKLEKIQGLATSSKAELDQAIASPDATSEQVKKLQKRSAAASKALDLYKLELADPAKEIEILNQKLANGNAVLAQNIEELQSRIIKAIPSLFREASQEVVKVSNLNEVPQTSPTKGQLAADRQAIAAENERRKALEIKALKNQQAEQKASQIASLPKPYVDAVQAVSRIVTGKDLEKDKIPNIVPDSQIAGRGQYSAQSNTYKIRPDLYEQLKTGDIEQVTNEALGNIIHEIFHGFQHDFGKAIADETGKVAVDITPTPDELLKVADKVESSVAIQPESRKPLSRQLETGANVFQLRNTDVVREELKRNQLKSQALSLGGVAGSKILLTDTNALIDNISNFLKEANVLGIDVSKHKAKLIGVIKEIRASAETVGAKSVNIDSLPTIEIEGIVKQYQEIIKTINDTEVESLELTSLLQSQSQSKPLYEAWDSSPKITHNNPLSLPQHQTKNKASYEEWDSGEAIASVQQELQPIVHKPQSSPHRVLDVADFALDIPKIELPVSQQEPELKFNSSKEVRKFASSNLNAKGVQDLARRMGIDTKNANKEHLLNEITSLVGTADSRSQIAQLATGLTPDKFLSASKSKAKSASPTDALKAIGELKKNRKALADTLKIAQELDVKERQIALSQIVEQAREQEAIAKTLSSEHRLTPAHSKSLGGVRSQLKSISNQSKESLAAVQASQNPGEIGHELGENLVSAIGSGMSVAAKKPIVEIQSVMGAIEGAAKSKAEIQSPSKVFQRIGKFIAEGLAAGITSGSGLVKEAIASLIGQGAKESLNTKKLALPPPPPPPWAVPAKKFSLPAPPPPPWVKPNQSAIVKVERNFPSVSERPIVMNARLEDRSLKALPQSSISQEKVSTPTPPQGFNLPTKVKQLVDKVKDSFEIFRIASDIAKDQAKNLNKKIREYDQTLSIIEDLQAEKAKQNQALDDKFDPHKIDQERERITQRAKLSANLERKYGMVGLAPEILPDRINESGETIKDSSSIFQGIKGIFKSLDNGIAKRVKKRASQLALEVQGAIAPSLESQAIAAQQRGDKVEQKQYQKLAKQARAASTGVAKILDSPGDLTEKQVKQLDRLTTQLEKVYDAIGRPLPSQGFLESFGLKAGGIVKSLGGVIKGFLAFQVGMWAQNFFGSIAQEAFKAYVELDRLKTGLNFASGGSAGGAQNLAFVRKQVEDLGIPLKASTEGFVGLAAAARGSALEGQQTRELFLGVSQASTVLTLSTEDTQGAILALSQMISKGKVSSEELRQQLGERVPGAMGIAARAMGVTEQEFQRLLDTGQILSQDFLPKFAKQLQSEFGDAAKDASNNAQSSIFKVQNAFLSLQQGIGEGVAPVATAGLNTFGAILKGLASVAKELGFILLAVTITISVKMVSALQAVIAQLIATKLTTGTLGGGFASLANTIKNSFSAKLTTGIFAVLEIVNLLNQAVNTELVASFEAAAEAAKRAAEESAKAFQKSAPDKTTGTEPRSSSGVGRFLDDYLIGFMNMDAGPFKGGNPFTGKKLKTYGQLEKQRVTDSTEDSVLGNTNFLSNARIRLHQLKSNTGDIGKLPALDTTLRDAEQRREILQAQIKRDYTDKGKATPADSKRRLEAQSLRITDLNNQRAEIAKPFTLDLTRTDRQINTVKAQIESLKSSEAIAAVGGDEAASKLTERLKGSLEKLKQFKAEAEAALAALRIDPVLAFSNALRQLNLSFAQSKEENQQSLDDKKAQISSKQLSGFSTNKLAGKQAAVSGAVAEQDKAKADLAALEAAVKQGGSAIAAPEFQTVLQRLGVNKNSSVAKIDDIIKNTSDDADKGILEKFKAEKERRLQLPSARGALSEAQLKVKQATQDISITELTESANKQELTLQRTETKKLNFVKMAQQMRVLSETDAAEKTARIQLGSTGQQQRNISTQLATLRAYHAQGKIGAEEFANRERELITRQVGLDRQSAEQRMAIFDAVNRRKLEQIELVNKKAEAAIALSQTTGTTKVKSGVLNADLSAEQAASAQNLVDQNASRDRIDFIKTEIAQTKQLQSERVISAKESTEKQLGLNQELAQAYQQAIDQQIQAQEQLRASIEKTFARRKQQLELENNGRDTQIQRENLDILKSSPATDLRGLELYSGGKSLSNKQESLASQAALVQEQLDNIDKLNLAEQDAADKKRELLTQLDGIRKEQISTEKALIQNQQETEINGIERLQKAEENRYKLAVSGIDEQKAALELYTASLERTAKLEESRYNLGKALGDVAVSGLEIKKSEADRALDLSRKLRDENIDPGVKSEVYNQLGSLGFGSSELSILAKRSQIEDEIAAKKLESLKLEQEYQRQSLKLDLQRQKIAAETAVYEAQSAQLAAAKSKLEAQSALRVAQIKKDDIGIQTAQVGIELADRGIALADKRVDSAQKNLAIQDELAQNAVKAQVATQGNAIAQQQAADSARKQAGALERVDAIAARREALAKQFEKNEASLPPASKQEQGDKSVEGWENPYTQKPGEDIFAYNLRINTMKMQGQIVETKNTASIVDQSGFNYDNARMRKELSLAPKKLDIPPMDTTALDLQASRLKAPDTTSGYAQFAEALKAANQGIEQRLDTLSDRILQLASSPRSLSVTSANPIDHAADFYNKIAKNQTAAAGL
jgi:tape measure domain-containing protein